MNKWILNVVQIIVALAVFAWFGLLLAHKIDLNTADLGRHIENGEIIVHGSLAEKWAVLHTNFYSYTLPDQPFINHHWLTGVVFYLVYAISGFVGLSVFYLIFGLAALLLFFDVARKASNFWIAAGLTIIVIPLIASRAEIRPEVFTYFLSGIFFWLLWHWRAGKVGTRWLLVLPLLMLAWVNLHIGFVFGFLILGAFGLERLIKDFGLRMNNRNRPWFGLYFLQLLLVSALCVILGLINPNFLKGFLYPLSIFKNYGYLVVENQSIKFLENINFTASLHFLLFKLVAGVIAAFFIVSAIKNWRKVDVAMLVLAVVSGVMAYVSIRNFPSFALFALPAMAANIYSIFPKNLHPAYSSALLLVGLILVFVAWFYQYQDYNLNKGALGLGLLPGEEAAASFFKQNSLQGPIFNDYDIGGYLIFNLFPERVFVDNRPEAYTTDFFQNTYIPAQNDQDKWLELYAQYKFNVIFFSYHDYTPWAQTFLLNRIKDPDWAPVFVDSYDIIFLRRSNPANSGIIKQYELPKSMFGTATN